MKSNRLIPRLFLGTLLWALAPVLAFAQDAGSHAPYVLEGVGGYQLVGLFLAFLVLSAVLTKVWIGIINVSLIDVENLSSIERRHPYLPSIGIIIATVLGTALLVIVSIGTMGAISPFEGPDGPMRAAVILGGLAAIMVILSFLWKGSKEYIFAFIVGTITSFILITFVRSIVGDNAPHDPLGMTLGIVAIILVWRFLFGPWEAHIKATVLGTFVFWVAFHFIFQEAPDEQTAHFIAIAFAAIPALIWCALFLPYHKERLSVVFLMFFSGMIATAPILFYDTLVRQKIELQFFIFRIVPQSFNMSVQSTVKGSGDASLQVSLLSLFLTFIIVGLLEEFSKYWVLKRNGQRYLTSIDDAIQLAIVVAIGFAFAENITNTGYFLSFVKEYLMSGQPVDWGGFLGNIAGRSILTSMVHIVSTGVCGYFFGVTVFADAEAQEGKKRRYFIAEAIHWLFGLEEGAAFRMEMLTLGIGIASLLHAFSNFLVTLPDELPGNPHTLGDLFNAPASSPLHLVALLLFPSLIYVVGGFWMLTSLILSKRNMEEHELPHEKLVLAK